MKGTHDAFFPELWKLISAQLFQKQFFQLTDFSSHKVDGKVQCRVCLHRTLERRRTQIWSPVCCGGKRLIKNGSLARSSLSVLFLCKLDNDQHPCSGREREMGGDIGYQDMGFFAQLDYVIPRIEVWEGSKLFFLSASMHPLSRLKWNLLISLKKRLVPSFFFFIGSSGRIRCFSFQSKIGATFGYIFYSRNMPIN